MNMEQQAFFDSLEPYRNRGQPVIDDSKPFNQVYTSGKNKGKKVKGIVVSILLYPDTDSHIACLKRLFDLGYNFACILHDKDYVDSDETKQDNPQDENTLQENDTDLTDEDLSEGIPVSESDSKLKKAHIHVVLLVQNPRCNTGIAKELKIPSRLVRIVNGLNVRLAYLCHRDNKDKYPYNPEYVCGPLSCRLQDALSECQGYKPDMALDVIHWIEGQKAITWSAVCSYCNRFGYNDILYSSKSSYYQSIRQAYFDKKQELKEQHLEENIYKTVQAFKTENQVLHAQMRLICEMLDIPIVYGETEFSNNILSNYQGKKNYLEKKGKR